MIETILLDYLTSKYNSGDLLYQSYPETPEEIPERYYRFEKTGGSRTNHIDTASVVIYSYAESLYECAVMAESLRSVMDDITDLPEVSSCVLTADAAQPNTTRKEYRYRTVYEITFY